ncbi:MAG TPA: carboxypeptidase-like regulatory domain-containing protein, partial [Herpetosiphonaceae bacterium]|nr:carboxypeptidase-like regulatory domain-containing protein [Herpetosiphonaceae bacterium]
PLANATVQVSGNNFSNGNTTYSASTDANGIYHLYLVLRSGVTSGNVSYSATYNGVLVQSTLPFAASANQLTELTNNFTVSERRLTFSGQIVNALAPGETVSSSKVEVAAAGVGKLCEYNYYYSFTNYSCSAQITTTNALSLTYTITGDWGSATVFGESPAAGVGSSSTVSKNLPVAPTTLHLTGKLTLPDGAPLNNARVVMESAAFAQSSATSDYTDATGTYHIYPILKQGVVAGTLNYSLRYSNGVQPATRNFSATANQLTEIPSDFTYRTRRIDFSGSIVNGLLGWTSYVPSTRVDVSAPGLGTLCSYAYTYNFNSYSCTAQITTTSALSVTYNVTGAWGSATLVEEVNADAIGSYTSASKDLAVSPTTIHLSGLALADGAPLLSARINVSGNGLVAGQSQYTVADGGYEMYLVLKAGITSGTLQFQAQHNNVSRNAEIAFNAPAGQLTPITQNADLSGQNLTFSGQIRNALVPTQTVRSRKVEVFAAGIGKLCEWSSSGSTSYSCTASVTTTSELNLTYAVSGDWGGASLSGSVSSGTQGGARTISKNLEVAPATLHLTGTVTNPDGQPLQSAYVWVESAGFSGSSSYGMYTDAAGAYHFYPVIKSGMADGTVTYHVSYDYGELTETRSFSAAAGQLTEVPASFVYNVRRVYVSGAIVNAHAPLTATAEVPSTSMVMSLPGGEPLCTRSSYYAFSSFGCSITVTTTDALSVTYAISGAWGSATVSDSIPAGAAGSYTNVQQSLAVSPTTLRLRGRLASAGDPLQSAWVSVSSPALVNSVGAYTDQDGNYDIFVALKADATGGSLNYQVYYQSVSLNEDHPFSAQPGGLTAIDRGFSIDQRSLYFSGQILNGLLPGQGLGATSVAISAPGLGQLCQWSSSWPNSSYSCTAQITATAALTPTYTVSGDWGSAVIVGAPIEEIPPVGQAASIAHDLVVTPTMVLLSGTVADPGGAPLAGAGVYVNSADLFGNSSLYATADENGAYEIYAVVNSGAISGSLEYTVPFNNAVMNFGPYAVTLNQGQINPVSRDLTFSARQVRFRGKVANALVPGTTVYADGVTISSPLLGELCSTSTGFDTAEGFTYDCSANVQTTAAFAVDYRFSGPWGETTVSATVPAAAINSETSFSQDVAVSPTTLRIAGRLSLPDTSPLAEARIWVGGDEVPYGLETTASAQGDYELYLPINNVVSGTLDIEIAYGEVYAAN